MKFAFKNVFEFNDYFKDEKTCYEFFEKLRWDGRPVCPHCGSEKYYSVKARGQFLDIPSYRCGNRACDLPFTVRTKSIFEGSKIEFRKWLLAAYELSTCKKGISSVELATRIGTSQKTAWLINHKLRAMLKETEPTLLGDVVAIDESYIGGKETNKHADKKTPGSHGRSYKAKKNMVIAARGLRGQIKAQVTRDSDSFTILPLAKKWIEKGSMVVTDEWRAYNILRDDYFLVQVNHSEGAYVNGCFSTNGVENFWSILKRGIIGTFHSVSPQHLQGYVNEFSDRYNKKDISNIERFEGLIQRAPNAQTTYKEVTGKQQSFKDYLRGRIKEPK